MTHSGAIAFSASLTLSVGRSHPALGSSSPREGGGLPPLEEFGLAGWRAGASEGGGRFLAAAGEVRGGDDLFGLLSCCLWYVRGRDSISKDPPFSLRHHHHRPSSSTTSASTPDRPLEPRPLEESPPPPSTSDRHSRSQGEEGGTSAAADRRGSKGIKFAR